MPNQRDVAKHAELSSATVSRYLADPESVSPEAARKIQAAIDDLGYHVDYSAQCLKTGKSNHIGILTPSIGPYYWAVISWLQWQLNEDGFFSTVFFTRDVNTLTHSYRDQVPPFLKKRQLDGVVFFPLLSREDDSILESLSSWGRPFVIADRSVPNASIYQTCIDNFSGGKKAARAFVEAGHRDFLFIWGTHDSAAATERFQGFKEVLDAEGIELGTDRQLNGEFNAEGAYRAASLSLGRLPPFTAVFASNDSSALGFMHAAKEAGLRCPVDYSIIGFDNNPDFAAFIDPPLSSFRQPVEDLGKATGAILLSLIRGEEPESHRHIFQPEFIPRASLRTLDR
jgi:DNA-binding LacI/PurR family transcriptional regulator